jgi:spermidine synthase
MSVLSPAPASTNGPTTGFSTGIFLLSLASLLLEIMQVRILAIALWPSLVYMAVTLAMLGFGVGGALLAIFPLKPREWSGSVFAWLCLGFAVSAVFGIRYIGAHPISSFHVFEQPRELALLIVCYSLLAVPFVFASMAIGAAFMAVPGRVGRYYALNLVGSGLGCVLFALAISPLGGEGVVLLSATLAAVAAVAFCVHPLLLKTLVVGGVFVAVGAISIPLGSRLIPVRLDPDKGMSFWTDPQRFPESRVVFRRWSALGRTDVVDCPSFILDTPGGGKRPYRTIFTDGSGTALMYKGASPEEWAALKQTDAYLYASGGIGYFLKKSPKILVIGVGGARDIEQALLHGARSITGVEINGDTVDAITSVLSGYINGMCNEPNVNILVGEGRSYVRNCTEKFDMIQLTAVDTEAAALARGAYMLAENYLFTIEAFNDYLDHLEKDGLIALRRRSVDPPREMMRLVTGASEALAEHGNADPWRHMIVIGNPPPSGQMWPALLCKKTPYTREEVEGYRHLAERLKMPLHYLPDMDEESLQYPDGRVNYYATFFHHLKAGTVQEFYDDYPFDVTPIRDDKPYFYKSYKLTDFRALFPGNTNQDVEENGPERNIGLMSIVVLILQAMVWQAILVFLPLALMHRKGLRVASAWRVVCYFICIGFGFMILEVSFMQKFVLFLGSPIYSISVTLATFLVFAGLGSYAFSRGRVSPASAMSISIAAIVTLSLIQIFLLPNILLHLLGYPFVLRVTATVILLAPMAFFMGIPLVSGLSMAHQVHPQVIPWVWGVNGAASVLASAVIVLTAMIFGFSINIMAAAAIYLLGFLAMRRFPAAEAHSGCACDSKAAGHQA